MTPNVISFLEQLKVNNNRDWFQQNKNRYEAAKSEVLTFVGSVIPAISGFDETVKFVEAKDCLFRIFRDVRFSSDKSPYKVNMGAWITPKGRKSSGPGYYIHLQPVESFLSVGVYMPDPDQLKKIRQEIFYNTDEFKAILSDRKIARYTTGLDDFDKAKQPPRDFPKDFADIDLLKYRHYILSASLDDTMIISDKLFAYVTEVFRTFSPLNRFLKRALEG